MRKTCPVMTELPEQANAGGSAHAADTVAAPGGEVAADFTRQTFRVFTYLPKLGEGESAIVYSGKLRTGPRDLLQSRK
jgi:hypothetical protein